GVVHGQEGRLAHVEAPLDDVVDVGTGGGQDHAGRDAYVSAAFTCDDDAVGGDLGGHVVGRAERRGVGEVGVDLGDIGGVGRHAVEGGLHRCGEEVGPGQRRLGRQSSDPRVGHVVHPA